MVKVDGGGLRHNAGKPRWSLVAWDAIGKVVDVYTFGAKKYADRNWERGMLYSYVFDSGMRHLKAWWSGEANDVESNLPHLAHFAWNAITLLAYETRGMGNVMVKHPETGEMVPADDRPGLERSPQSFPTGSDKLPVGNDTVRALDDPERAAEELPPCECLAYGPGGVGLHSCGCSAAEERSEPSIHTGPVTSQSST